MIFIHPDIFAQVVAAICAAAGISAFVGAGGVALLRALLNEIFHAYGARRRLAARRRMAARIGGVQ